MIDDTLVGDEDDRWKQLSETYEFREREKILEEFDGCNHEDTK